MKTQYFEAANTIYKIENGIISRRGKTQWEPSSARIETLKYDVKNGNMREIENPDAPKTVIHTPDETQFKSRLGYLQFLFINSGMKGNPIISDKELRELADGLKKTQGFMKDRGDKSISFCLMMEIQSVEGMIYAREKY